MHTHMIPLIIIIAVYVVLGCIWSHKIGAQTHTHTFILYGDSLIIQKKTKQMMMMMMMKLDNKRIILPNFFFRVIVITIV